MIKKITITFLLILCGFTCNSYSQTDSEQGRIYGVVATKDGAVIPNAKIFVTAKNFRVETKTDMAGQYEVIVPPGTYNIIVEAIAFRKFKKKNVNINRQAYFLLNIVLKYGEPIIVD